MTAGQFGTEGRTGGEAGLCAGAVSVMFRTEHIVMTEAS
jgi:hypothetical protein